ncbi:MAG: multicopper oxidase family protein [Gemmatimonadota bacterium]|nr:multicopper oxidase family protein [Gemmatimonadota bacterium]
MAHRCTLLALLTLSGSLLAQSPPRAVATSARAGAAPKAESSNPPVLVNTSKLPKTVEVNITAAVTTLSLQPGINSEVFAYNGTIPGPTLDVREGDHVIVHFRNDLPEPTTVHWHGIHLPFESDGSPFHPIKPGETHDYEFTVRAGTAGTYWYHPHPDHRTGFAIGKGLFGGIVVHAANDPLPPMPEKLIILSDNRFLKDGLIDFPDPMSHHGGVDEENGREGPVLFVNGHVMPVITIRSGEVQRWRIVNGSAGRIYRIAIPGRALVHVGSDGGLFEKPVEVKDIVLTTGERVEVLVRGTDPPGTKTTLQNLPYDRYAPQTRPADWETTRDLLTLQTTDEKPVTPVAIPASLRKITPLDTAKSTAVRTIVFSQGLINGKTMDMARVDVSTTVGATEIWDIENIVGMDHPFHLHGFQFQVLDRNGVPEPYRSWKDMLNIPKHTSARIIVRYDDYPGKWMFHCHILDHEDHGMMGVLEVK